MTQADYVPAILDRLADLVEYADSLPSMVDSKKCPDSSAGLLCYDQWCIKNNDCFDRIARTQP